MEQSNPEYGEEASSFFPKRKGWFGNFANIVLLTIAVVSFIAVFLVLILSQGKPNAFADLLLVLLSVICSVLASFMASGISHKREIKKYALSSMRHLRVVFDNCNGIRERIEREMNRLESTDEVPDRRAFEGLLESLDDLAASLARQIENGVSNWENILEDEFEAYREAYARLMILERDRAELQRQLEDAGEANQAESVELREKIAVSEIAIDKINREIFPYLVSGSSASSSFSSSSSSSSSSDSEVDGVDIET